MSRFHRFIPSTSTKVVPGHLRSPISASLSEIRRGSQSHTSPPSPYSLRPTLNSWTKRYIRTADKSFQTLRSAPSYPNTHFRRTSFDNSFDTSVLEEEFEDVPEVSVSASISAISPSAYEQPQTPKTIENTKSKNTIPVDSSSQSMSPVYYRSPSPTSANDSSQWHKSSFGIKDPFMSNLHFVRMDESCNCSKCDAACNDLDVSDSMTLYSAESVSFSVEDDSSLIPILEPCMAFSFTPYTSAPSSPSTSYISESSFCPSSSPSSSLSDESSQWLLENSLIYKDPFHPSFPVVREEQDDTASDSSYWLENSLMYRDPFPHTPSKFDPPPTNPHLDAEVADDSGSRWIHSAVALGVAVVSSLALAWALW
ncbi:hypothetical protein ONS95_008968 [Cadophora gregata]|uniref:uncharacterized protein n=1 Tax=Cadophora gregata TaxID=51156 RepID=UPI0026DC4B92|nr:uncharacterized protein ONS95_008968 [Cadophora gregata]KAK0123980.1 hypothetical protein ONS95_008968 [Cadophora gregata]KAK0130319.1 hypothetical protein ONS96_000840 [Cadophora gregata f. sp. sojae]